MNDLQRLRNLIHKTCSLQYFGVLATAHDNRPYTTLVAFALSDDLSRMIFVTPRATRKFNYLMENNKISFMVDNRTNQSTDIIESVGITLSGTAREPQKEEHDSMLNLYLKKHPDMKKFAESPNSALICMDVERYDVVQRFQNVLVLEIN